MPTTFFVVRHGQSTGNVQRTLNGHSDEPLTDLGRQQALETAGLLQTKQIDCIYSSPLLRARETAEIIGAELDLPVTVWQSLIERDFGTLTGKPIDELDHLPDDQVIKTDQVTYFLEAEGSEGFPQLLERAKIKVLGELETLHPDQTVLLVAHGDIGKMVYAAYYDMDWQEGLRTPYFGNANILELRKAH